MSDTQKIQWDQPLEAVNDDGEIRKAKVRELDLEAHNPESGVAFVEIGEDYSLWFKPDGEANIITKWRLRNVAPKEVEWGQEIKVEGKWPEWLRDDVFTNMGDTIKPARFWSFDGSIKSFRLPASHPHYSTWHTYTVAPEDEAALNTSRPTPTRIALEQRMEDLVRRMAADWSYMADGRSFSAEARAIVAEMPKPVDPEYERAEKELTELWYDENRFEAVVKFAVEQVARGRALERGESPVTNEGAGR